MGKWLELLKDIEKQQDAVKFSKAEGLLGYLRSEGFTVNRLKTGHGIVVGPASRIDDDIRRMVRDARPQLYTLLVIEEVRAAAPKR